MKDKVSHWCRNSRKNRTRKNKSSEDTSNGINIELYPPLNCAAVDFLHHRLGYAFPGSSRGITEIDNSKKIINGLTALLREPLTFEDNKIDYLIRPLLWVRGDRTESIESFRVLKKNKILINTAEHIVEKVIINKDSSRRDRCFVYLECSADKPTGVYEYDDNTFREAINSNGYMREDYAIHKNRNITMEEYYDGAIYVRNKPILLEEVELRTRYLSEYNFMIVVDLYSPYVMSKFQLESGAYFDRLVKKEIEFSEYFKWLRKLPKNPNKSRYN